MHTNDGSSSSRNEYAIPCGVSTSKRIALLVVVDKISRRKSSFSDSIQGGVGGKDTVGREGVVGTSTGMPGDGAVAGALVGIGSRVGSVGPLDGTEGLVGNVGVGGPVGRVRVGRVVSIGAVLVGVGATGVLVGIGMFDDTGALVGVPPCVVGALVIVGCGLVVGPVCVGGASVGILILMENVIPITDSKYRNRPGLSSFS